MKIRKGFVSNSSTTSFVIVGIKLPVDKYMDEDKDIYFEDYAESIGLEGFNDGYGDEAYMGLTISSDSSEDYEKEDGEMPLSEITKMGEQVKKKLKKAKIPFKDKDIKLYSFTLST